MDDAARLRAFEEHCHILFSSPSANLREAAQNALMQLNTSLDYIPQCQYVLTQSSMAQAQLIAANALSKLIGQFWNQLTVQQRLDHRNHALNFLANAGPGCENYVVIAVGQLVADITKVGWFDAVEHQQIVSELGKFLAASPAHVILGLQLLEQIVTSMNSSGNMRSLTQHRKVAGNFRDNSLFEIMQVALHTIRKLSQGINATEREQRKILERSLKLVLACLSYDFIGTSLDEASEELGTIQVPTSWRSIMEDPATQALFFDAYRNTSPPESTISLEVLVLLASLRRSLFSSDEDRQSFLGSMMQGTLIILSTQHGLTHPENYHELCRLLARLKTNFQLSELVLLPQYSDWISAVAAFTIDSFKHWQWAANSMYYLLSLWSRLVAAMPYMKGSSTTHLENCVPQVITAFITSRMELVRALLLPRDDQIDLEDPFTDEEQLMELLDTLPALCRFQLQQVASYALSLFEPSARLYTMALALPPGERNGTETRLRLAQCEGELAWLVYIISMVLSSHIAPNLNSESQQLVDGELATAVLQLLPLIDAPSNLQERRLEPSNRHLDIAVIFFLQQFRKVYIGDQAASSSKVYVCLEERLNIGDHLSVLNVIMNKIVTDLTRRPDCCDISSKALNLFADLAGGYCSSKLMLRLDSVQRMLINHSGTDFPFLEVPGNAPLRTLFCSTLCKLLFLEETNVKFKTFMVPLTELLVCLRDECIPTKKESEQMRSALIGVLRDMRGIVVACSNRRTYSLFFEWLYPAFTPLLQRVASLYYNSPEVMTPLLKFYAELVHNKAQRLTFDSSSPNGILLFREMSAVLIAYGSQVLHLEIPAGADPYERKYKGISLVMTILARALSGNYVNFGVFALYGDRAMADCMEVTIKLCLCMRMDEILAYPKVSKAYFTLIELLMRNHTNMLIEFETPVLQHICSSLQEGLKSYEVSISSQCAAALEHLAAFYFRQLSEEREQPAKLQIKAHLSRDPMLFSSPLEVLLHMVVFEDCANQWSLSRPLLALILTNNDCFLKWKNDALAAQVTYERQQKLALAFDKLMADVQPNLEAKNRDKFTQNLTLFRHEMKSIF